MTRRPTPACAVDKSCISRAFRTSARVAATWCQNAQNPRMNQFGSILSCSGRTATPSPSSGAGSESPPRIIPRSVRAAAESVVSASCAPHESAGGPRWVEGLQNSARPRVPPAGQPSKEPLRHASAATRGMRFRCPGGNFAALGCSNCLPLRRRCFATASSGTGGCKPPCPTAGALPSAMASLQALERPLISGGRTPRPMLPTHKNGGAQHEGTHASLTEFLDHTSTFSFHWRLRVWPVWHLESLPSASCDGDHKMLLELKRRHAGEPPRLRLSESTMLPASGSSQGNISEASIKMRGTRIGAQPPSSDGGDSQRNGAPSTPRLSAAGASVSSANVWIRHHPSHHRGLTIPQKTQFDGPRWHIL